MVDVFIWVTFIVSAKVREDSGCYSNVLWMPYSWVHLSMSYNYSLLESKKQGAAVKSATGYTSNIRKYLGLVLSIIIVAGIPGQHGNW